MNEKYLPLGTVCETNGRKVLIVGYGALSLKNNLKIMDYIGCAYPEGLLSLDKIISFNNSEIEKIHFLGFVSDEFKNFNQLLNGELQKFYDDKITLPQNRVYSKFNFDKNGVVKDEIVYEFNNAGVLVSTDTKTLTVPDQKTNGYELDENGTLISVDDGVEEEVPPIGPGLPGYVEPKKESKYKFDENGTLISVDDGVEEEVPPIGPGLPGYIEPKKESKYKFDENGTLIRVDDATAR